MKNIVRIVCVLVLAWSIMGITTTAFAGNGYGNGGNPHDCTANPDDPACKNPGDPTPISGNPTDLPDPICEVGQHVHNKHCVPDSDPTEVVTEEPTEPAVTEAPTDAPTDVPTDSPTEVSTEAPTDVPTDSPTEVVTNTPEVTGTPESTSTAIVTETATSGPEATPTAASVPEHSRPPKTGFGDHAGLPTYFGMLFGSLFMLGMTFTKRKVA